VSPLLLLTLALPQGAPAEGLTLVAPIESPDAFLVDLQGEIVQAWPGTLVPALAAYLLPSGNLLRTVNTQAGAGAGSRGGGLQEVTWTGEVLWDWRYDGPGVLSHHDVEVMPNGNILVLAWEDKTNAEAVAAGRDPALLNPVAGKLMPEHILEIQPVPPQDAIVVWEWHAWDHLVQDYDPTKPDFGNPADSPERIDLNYPPLPPPASGDWMHANSLDYNAELDQILISVKSFNEIWVIDHSTTTAEAAGSTGGRYGKGGDLLYRWGNPEAWGRGGPADRILQGQHDAQWIPEGSPGAGNILILNNGIERIPQASSVDEIVPPVDAQGNYSLNAQGLYDPPAPVWSWQAPNPTDFFTETMGGCERLPNGNTLVCSANQGWIFEVDPAGNVVWEYWNTIPSTNTPDVFKVRRYTLDLFPDRTELSAAAGGQIRFLLLPGSDQAGRDYILAASGSGTEPGTRLPGNLVTLPLNRDGITDRVLAAANGPSLVRFQGQLDGNGRATPIFDSLGPLSASLAGTVVHFAYALSNPWDYASEAVAVEILP